MTKPTLGLIPQWIHKEMRLEEIQEAINRYKEAGKDIPEAWIAEACELRCWIDTYHSIKSNIRK